MSRSTESLKRSSDEGQHPIGLPSPAVGGPRHRMALKRREMARFIKKDFESAEETVTTIFDILQLYLLA